MDDDEMKDKKLTEMSDEEREMRLMQTLETVVRNNPIQPWTSTEWGQLTYFNHWLNQ